MLACGWRAVGSCCATEQSCLEWALYSMLSLWILWVGYAWVGAVNPYCLDAELFGMESSGRHVRVVHVEGRQTA